MPVVCVVRETREVELQRRLRNAKERLRRAKADVAEIEADLFAMFEADALEQIKSWRGKPDWNALLNPDGGTHMYMLSVFMLQRMGLDTGMTNPTIQQNVVSFRVPTSADPDRASAAVARRRRALEAILPSIRTNDKGQVEFSVFGEGVDAFALSLCMTATGEAIELVRMEYGREVDRVPFDDLGEALTHIQLEYPGPDVDEEWVPDPAGAPGSTGEAQRRAIEAFVEGCRVAGKPIPDCSQDNALR